MDGYFLNQILLVPNASKPLLKFNRSGIILPMKTKLLGKTWVFYFALSIYSSVTMAMPLCVAEGSSQDCCKAIPERSKEIVSEKIGKLIAEINQVIDQSIPARQANLFSDIWKLPDSDVLKSFVTLQIDLKDWVNNRNPQMSQSKQQQLKGLVDFLTEQLDVMISVINGHLTCLQMAISLIHLKQKEAFLVLPLDIACKFQQNIQLLKHFYPIERLNHFTRLNPKAFPEVTKNILTLGSSVLDWNDDLSLVPLLSNDKKFCELGICNLTHFRAIMTKTLTGNNPQEIMAFFYAFADYSRHIGGVLTTDNLRTDKTHPILSCVAFPAIGVSDQAFQKRKHLRKRVLSAQYPLFSETLNNLQNNIFNVNYKMLATMSLYLTGKINYVELKANWCSLIAPKTFEDHVTLTTAAISKLTVENIDFITTEKAKRKSNRIIRISESRMTAQQIKEIIRNVYQQSLAAEKLSSLHSEDTAIDGPSPQRGDDAFFASSCESDLPDSVESDDEIQSDCDEYESLLPFSEIDIDDLRGEDMMDSEVQSASVGSIQKSATQRKGEWMRKRPEPIAFKPLPQMKQTAMERTNAKWIYLKVGSAFTLERLLHPHSYGSVTVQEYKQLVDDFERLNTGNGDHLFFESVNHLKNERNCNEGYSCEFIAHQAKPNKEKIGRLGIHFPHSRDSNRKVPPEFRKEYLEPFTSLGIDIRDVMIVKASPKLKN
jgi:hypothetical protein